MPRSAMLEPQWRKTYKVHAPPDPRRDATSMSFESTCLRVGAIDPTEQD